MLDTNKQISNAISDLANYKAVMIAADLATLKYHLVDGVLRLQIGETMYGIAYSASKSLGRLINLPALVDDPNVLNTLVQAQAQRIASTPGTVPTAHIHIIADTVYGVHYTDTLPVTVLDLLTILFSTGMGGDVICVADSTNLSLHVDMSDTSGVCIQYTGDGCAKHALSLTHYIIRDGVRLPLGKAWGAKNYASNLSLEAYTSHIQKFILNSNKVLDILDKCDMSFCLTTKELVTIGSVVKAQHKQQDFLKKLNLSELVYADIADAVKRTASAIKDRITLKAAYSETEITYHTVYGLLIQLIKATTLVGSLGMSYAFGTTIHKILVKRFPVKIAVDKE